MSNQSMLSFYLEPFQAEGEFCLTRDGLLSLARWYAGFKSDNANLPTKCKEIVRASENPAKFYTTHLNQRTVRTKHSTRPSIYLRFVGVIL